MTDTTNRINPARFNELEENVEYPYQFNAYRTERLPDIPFGNVFQNWNVAHER